MSNLFGGLSVVCKRKENGVFLVDCPFCGKEHGHFNMGVNTAICGQGEYSIVAPWEHARA